MFTPFRNPFRKMSAATLEELNAICSSQQYDLRRMPGWLQRDIGLDCGCLNDRARVLRNPYL